MGLNSGSQAYAMAKPKAKLSPNVLAAMIKYPIWYDAYRDRLCSLETTLDNLEAETRTWREDHQGWSASGISLWKRRHFRAFLADTNP